MQVFVGVGAARVRDMYRQARENAPCIIFIDEIDAVGRQRGSGSSNDEREQTLNQLLVEMDGFDGNAGVITIAATNRVDILDEALVRAGRFDRKVEVGLPDASGRVEILKVHARNKPLAPDVDLDQVARRTPGLSGASLQNLMNEAAIHAARDEKEIIEWDDVDWAIDRVTVGMEKPNKDALVQDIELVAFHEAGHAIVGGSASRVRHSHEDQYRAAREWRWWSYLLLSIGGPSRQRGDSTLPRESDCCRVGRSPCRGACIRSRKSYYGRLG